MVHADRQVGAQGAGRADHAGVLDAARGGGGQSRQLRGKPRQARTPAEAVEIAIGCVPKLLTDVSGGDLAPDQGSELEVHASQHFVAGRGSFRRPCHLAIVAVIACDLDEQRRRGGEGVVGAAGQADGGAIPVVLFDDGAGVAQPIAIVIAKNGGVGREAQSTPRARRRQRGGGQIEGERAPSGGIGAGGGAGLVIVGVVRGQGDVDASNDVETAGAAQAPVGRVLAVEVEVAVDLGAGAGFKRVARPVGSDDDFRRQAQGRCRLTVALGRKDVVVMDDARLKPGKGREAAGPDAERVIGGLRPITHGDRAVANEEVDLRVLSRAQSLGRGVGCAEQQQGDASRQDFASHRPPAFLRQPFSY